MLQPPPPNPAVTPTPLYIVPASYDPTGTLAGAVIPGISIKATPACAGLGTPGPDQYVAGATHSTPQSFASGSYSLFAQVGAKGANGNATTTLDIPVATPTAPTLIDSWAAVLE